MPLRSRLLSVELCSCSFLTVYILGYFLQHPIKRPVGTSSLGRGMRRYSFTLSGLSKCPKTFSHVYLSAKLMYSFG